MNNKVIELWLATMVVRKRQQVQLFFGVTGVIAADLNGPPLKRTGANRINGVEVGRPKFSRRFAG